MKLHLDISSYYATMTCPFSRRYFVFFQWWIAVDLEIAAH